jgi:D-alanyl-D-alanine carboxypeptidase
MTHLPRIDVLRRKRMNGPIVRLSLLIIALFLVAPSALSADKPDGSELATRFQSRLNQLQQDFKFPGATAAFMFAGSPPVCVATGLADREAGIAMTPKSRLMSGSIGKTFVAAVALDLVHQRKLQLDGLISQWIGDEEWFGRLPNANQITLRMLLSHTSGLTDHVYSEGYALKNQELLQRFNRGELNLDTYLKPVECVQFVLDKEPLFPAGEGFKYTDTGYLLVGLIIEKACGSTYYDLLQQRFLTPIGLDRTSPSNQRTLPGLASGYLDPNNLFGLPEKISTGSELLINPAVEWTGGGLVTNSRDLVKWATALYGGTAMDSPYLNQMYRSALTPDKDAKNYYGLGVSVRNTKRGRVVGHSGWFPGYNAIMVYFEDHDLAIAMQVNTDHDQNLRSYVDALADALLEN